MTAGEYMSVPQAAALLGVPADYLTREYRAGWLPVVRFGRSVRVGRDVIAEYRALWGVDLGARVAVWQGNKRKR